MSKLKFHWFLPTNGGDGRNVVGGGHGVSAGGGGRPASVPYLGQIARSAEQLGFEAALTPTGAWCEDAWVSTAMLSSVSERLKFLVAFRPGLISPFLAAQMAGTSRTSPAGGSLLNVVTGGESHEQRMFGDFLDKDGRYQRCDEFLTIVRALWTGEPVTFEGEHLRVEDAVLSQIPDPLPQIYFGGSSPAAGRVAARHVDVYLTWGEPPAAVAEKVAWISGLPRSEGRRSGSGSGCTRSRGRPPRPRGPRPTGCCGASPSRTSPASGGPAEERVRRPAADARPPPRGRRTPRDPPNLWAGVGLVRGGAGTAMVGSHTEIADLIEEYRALGIEEFVLSGYPHLEESYWFGEGVLPELARRGLWEHPAPVAAPASVPFGSGSRAAS